MLFADMHHKLDIMSHVDSDGIAMDFQLNIRLIKPLILLTRGKYWKWELISIINNADQLS